LILNQDRKIDHLKIKGSTVKNTSSSKLMGSGSSTLKPMKSKTFAQTYKVGRELGSGAFSTVRLAIHMDSNRETAVKVVSRKKLSDDDLDSLWTEIRILKSLDHPHIIKLYETFEDDLEIYIVTELVEGGELFDRIVRKAHYNEKEARDLIRSLLETLSYMHGSGIVHRDLKPENLLLTSDADDAEVKIADFGFAKQVQDLLPKETACGTPGYVAPEILRGDRYNCEVYIWSLGVICYVLLAGYPPFYDEDQRRLFKKIKEGRYYFHEDYWGSTSPEAIDLIRKMLCVDQSKRWSAKQLLSHEWIKMGDETLEGRDLTNSIAVMRKFNARRRLKSAADAIIMTNRMNRLMNATKAAAKVTRGTSVKISLVELELEDEEEEGDRLRMEMNGSGNKDFHQSISDEIDSNDPMYHPAIALLNDKTLD